VDRAIREALAGFDRAATFAVRSSALGEDADVSFAGLHLTRLNVPRDAVPEAWLDVVASLFADAAIDYRDRHGLPMPAADMAVGCFEMVAAQASGVLYTVDPHAPAGGAMVVSATWGLGAPLVEGRASGDRFTVSRSAPHPVTGREIADKREQCLCAPQGGIVTVPVAPALAAAPAVSDPVLASLAEAALRVERHMGSPQDVEWVLGPTGEVIVLQARPLRLGQEARPRPDELLAARRRHRLLLEGRGQVACRGVGAGRVFEVGPNESTEGFTAGDVIVTAYASPRLAGLVGRASAVVSAVGSVTGHLATVAREHRVPAIFGVGEVAGLFAPGAVVTVDADENAVYEGAVDELLRYALLAARPYQETPEFRVLRRMLRHVAPLNLGDPASADFAPDSCRTYHDIIRFAHERALAELGRVDDRVLGGSAGASRSLDLDIAFDLDIIDLGGAVAEGTTGRRIRLEQLASRPLLRLLEGVLTPGAWSTDPAGMDLEGFMASATRGGPLTGPSSAMVRRNIAVAGADYVNLNLRVGYHFNVIDCALGERPEENYVFFRFVGGVTDMTRRTRRARLLAEILIRYGFKAEVSGEIVVGRLQDVSAEICEDRLRMVGRLVGFSRQLDIVLRNDRCVDRLVEAFIQGRYLVSPDVLTKECDHAVRH
jgi:pyruvate,water dikinase